MEGILLGLVEGSLYKRWSLYADGLLIKAGLTVFVSFCVMEMNNKYAVSWKYLSRTKYEEEEFSKSISRSKSFIGL